VYGCAPPANVAIQLGDPFCTSISYIFEVKEIATQGMGLYHSDGEDDVVKQCQYPQTEHTTG
jgi:hypothetical protein